MIDETIEDLHTIAAFLQELQKLKAQNDDKLKALIKLLKGDPVLKKHKVLIFSGARWITGACIPVDASKGNSPDARS
ncbi:MAG TPA: hypothetical protein VFF64_27130 [Candidatus Eremiobacteraceae bacterium]|nr:hypothetical protein [Candidatus Eremiobacteraceae bacterium]